MRFVNKQLLFELGKFKDIIKYICLSFVSFLPLFYFSCIYYFGSLIFCCQFVASFIISDAKMLYNLYFENNSVTKYYSGADGLTNITSSAVTPSRKYSFGVFSSGIPSSINAAIA